MAALVDFASSLGLPHSLYTVTPEVVVWFLISRDTGAHTIVHHSDCDALWQPHPSSVRCSDPRCTRRLNGSTLKVKCKQLSHSFRTAGLVADWSPQAQTGNPVRSQPVRDYVRRVNAEQSAARVQVKQAPLFHEQVYHQLMRTILQRATDFAAAGQHLPAALALQDALLYSVMWYTGSRAQDTLRFLASDFRPLHAPADPELVTGWDIRNALSKTRRDPSATFHSTLANDGSEFHPIFVRSVWHSALGSLDLAAPRGLMFRAIVADAHGHCVFGKVTTTAHASARLAHWLAEAQLPPSITLHSFHGSHAAHRMLLGHLQVDIIRDMDWSLASLTHYLNQVILTLSGSIASPLSRQRVE